MILETVNYLSLYSEVKAGLRRPGDDPSSSPDPPTEKPPDPPKLLQMTLGFKPQTSKRGPSPGEYHGSIPGCIVRHRLGSRLLTVPPLRQGARWIWARTGYQASFNRRTEVE